MCRESRNGEFSFPRNIYKAGDRYSGNPQYPSRKRCQKRLSAEFRPSETYMHGCRELPEVRAGGLLARYLQDILKPHRQQRRILYIFLRRERFCDLRRLFHQCLK